MHLHKLSPYIGNTVQGVVRETYLRGQSVYQYDKGITAIQATGEILYRE